MDQTELNMVNTLLRTIGESAVNAIDLGHPDIVHARNLWDEYSLEIQSFGWWFNKEEWQLKVDTSGKVPIDPTVIAVDGVNTKYIKKGRYLYDLEAHSYDFTEASEEDLKLTLVTNWSLEELPPVMYNYILAVCKLKMLTDLAFDANKVQLLSVDADRRYFMAQKHQLRFGKPTAQYAPTPAQLLMNQSRARY